MEDRPIIIPTYKRVWKIERVMYKIDRIKLIRPVSYWQLGYFVLALIFIAATGIFNFLPVMVRYLLLPIAVSFYLSKAKHDGKAPHRWIITYVKYLTAPKVFNRYKPIVVSKSEKYLGSCTFRELYEREDAGSAVTPGTSLQAEEG